jgi:hypothetical protein
MKHQIESNTSRNLDRVKNLAAIYKDKLAGTGSGRRPVNAADILRATTVLLHASLEDFLREIARWKLPIANADALNEVPIARSDGKGHKFTLGNLVKFRGKSIDDVIKDSVLEHLEQSTYNNIHDVKTLLQAIGHDPLIVDEYAAKLGEMMARRHHIVHRADKNESVGPGHYSAQSISHEQVAGWIDTTERFVAKVLSHI